MAPPYRVGAVSYLNAKPLYHGLCELAPEVKLTMDVPSRLAEQLASGELDVALIPSVEYLRGSSRLRDYSGIRDRGAGSRSQREALYPDAVEKVDRLATDAGSRTSQVLARIWLDALCMVFVRHANRRIAAGGFGARKHRGRGADDRRPGNASAWQVVS